MCHITADSSVFKAVDRVLATFEISGFAIPLSPEVPQVDLTINQPVERLTLFPSSRDTSVVRQTLYVECKDSMSITWDATQNAFATTAAPVERDNKYKSFVAWAERQTAERDIVDRLKAELLADEFSAYSIRYLDYYEKYITQKEQYHREIVHLFDDHPTYLDFNVAFQLGRLRKSVESIRIDLDEYQLESYILDDTRTAARDRPVLLKLWFVSCAPCIKDKEKIIADRSNGTFPDVQLVGLSVDRNSENWRSYLDKTAEEWPNRRFQEPEQTFAFMAAIGVRMLFPSYALLDDDNRLIKTFHGYSAVKAYFETEVTDK